MSTSAVNDLFKQINSVTKKTGRPEILDLPSQETSFQDQLKKASLQCDQESEYLLDHSPFHGLRILKKLVIQAVTDSKISEEKGLLFLQTIQDIKDKLTISVHTKNEEDMKKVDDIVQTLHRAYLGAKLANFVPDLSFLSHMNSSEEEPESSPSATDAPQDTVAMSLYQGPSDVGNDATAMSYS